MKSKLNSNKLIIYTQDYNSIDFKCVISEDKLDEYINFFIQSELDKCVIKFKVLKTIKEDGYVGIQILRDKYILDYNNKEYPESLDGISFYYTCLNDYEINKFL
jgi:transcription elongation factor